MAANMAVERWTQSTVSDFSAGQLVNMAVLSIGDGALTPTVRSTGSPIRWCGDCLGTYVSQAHSSERPFSSVAASAQWALPQGSSIDLYVRSGPDGNQWGLWVPIQPGGAPVPLGEWAGYAQIKATFRGQPAGELPVLSSLSLDLYSPELAEGPPIGFEGLSTTSTSVATYRLYATRIGLVGEGTANGHVISKRDHFVALPSQHVLCTKDGIEYQVQIKYKDRVVAAPVWDVGPWNILDNYWDPVRDMWNDLPIGVPEAQAAYLQGYNEGRDQFGRKVLNPAGIDLADGTFWDDLGMTGSDWVEVTFLWTQQVGPRAGVLINNGAAASSTLNAELKLPATDPDDVSKMRVGNFQTDGSISWGRWQPYSSTLAWKLADGEDGTRTVYAQFKDMEGRVSPKYADSIEFARGVPPQLNPRGGSMLWKLPVKFTWETVGEATSYRVRIQERSSGTTVLDQEVGADSTSFRTDALVPGITYAWSVSSFVDGGWSKWSTALTFWVVPTVQAMPSTNAAYRYFTETGHNMGYSFRKYWESNGGLMQFGYPLTEEYLEKNSETGETYTVQYFERARFEYHPEYAGTEHEVLLGLLGKTVTDGRSGEPSFRPIEPFENNEDAVYFEQTGHSLAWGFKGYWQATGGLAVYGYPISQEFEERSETDGEVYTVQYFERNRFEYHPEYAGTEYEVLLGHLGRHVLQERKWLK